MRSHFYNVLRMSKAKGMDIKKQGKMKRRIFSLCMIMVLTVSVCSVVVVDYTPPDVTKNGLKSSGVIV